MFTGGDFADSVERGDLEGRGAVDRGTVAELAVVVIAEGPDGAVVTQGHDVLGAGAQLADRLGAQGGRVGLVGVTGIAGGVGGADAVIIPGVGGQSGVLVGGDVGCRDFDFGVGSGQAGFPLDAVTAFKRRAVGPRQVDLRGGDSQGAQVGHGGRERDRSQGIDLVGIGGVALLVGGPKPVKIERSAGDAGVDVGGNIRADLGDFGVGSAGADLTFQPEAGFVGGVVLPGKADLGGRRGNDGEVGRCARRQGNHRGRRLGRRGHGDVGKRTGGGAGDGANPVGVGGEGFYARVVVAYGVGGQGGDGDKRPAGPGSHFPLQQKSLFTGGAVLPGQVDLRAGNRLGGEIGARAEGHAGGGRCGCGKSHRGEQGESEDENPRKAGA